MATLTYTTVDQTGWKEKRPTQLRRLFGERSLSDAVELYQLGCEYAQGFAFGEPMDADAAMRLLTEERLEAAS